MANVYVWSGASGSANGADWTNAYTTLAAAFTAKAAGDVLFVAHDHASSDATAVTLTSPGTPSNPCYVYCVNRSGSVPPVSADLRTTATISTTGNVAITFNGHLAICYGITFTAGNSTGTANLNLANGVGSLRAVNCAFRLGGSGANSRIMTNPSGEGALVDLTNCTMQFGATGQAIQIGSNFTWRGSSSSITGATLPTTLFKPVSGYSGLTLLEGIDVSALGSGKTIVGALSSDQGVYILKDCRLGTSVTPAAARLSPGEASVILINCDSGATNTRSEKHSFVADETTETTIIRTGGASDGTTGQSRKIVTTANARPALPFEAMPISIWNDTTGSAITLTVEGIWGGGAVPNNDDIWMDVEYLGSSSYPLGSFATCGKADLLAAGTGLSSSSETWGGSTTKFKMAVTITPQMKGPITVYVKAGKASSTFYVDPKITVT